MALGKKKLARLITLFLLLGLGILPLSALATTMNGAVGPPGNVVSGTSSSSSSDCKYYFYDTYYGAQSATPPAQPATNLGGNSVGPQLQLQFGSSTAYPNSSPVPCDGYYEVSFSVQIRNDSGTSCHDGLNSMAIWSTTNDPATPNAYGCPTRFYDGYWNSSTWVNTTYTLSPNGNNNVPYSCATFNQWVQCAWTNNGVFGNMYNYSGGNSVHAYPMFMYTRYWTVSPSISVYKNVPSLGANVQEPYGNFCNGFDSQWGGQGYCSLSNSYPNVFTYQTAYCTSKTFYFKNVIYLHKGATVSAPTLQSLIAQEPYTNGMSPGEYKACGFSVTGGRFSLVFLNKNSRW